MSKQGNILDSQGFEKDLIGLATCYDRKISDSKQSASTEQEPTHRGGSSGRLPRLGSLTQDEYTEMFHRGEIL